MKIYAQHGFQPGDKIREGLKNQVIDGVIYGAKDIPPDQLRADLSQIVKNHPAATRLLDPHYYATFIANEPGARLGSLAGNDAYPYFRAHARRDLEQNDAINKDIQACLEFQADLPLTAFISPNIVIRRSFDSIEGVIAKNFIRNASRLAKKTNPRVPVYATLAISENALNDKNELQTFLQEITELEEPPAGFYLLLERPDTTPPSYLTESNTLARWMLINYALKINGFEIINGYTDLLAPYIAATGADAAGTGWFGTLKCFSLQKFRAVPFKISRQPIPRYTSVNLLKSIQHTELASLRETFPDVLNNLPSDDYYVEDGHPNPTEGALQNWEALKAMITYCTQDQVDINEALTACHAALTGAMELYARIGDSPFALRDRSNAQHIEAIREEINAFRKLAELQPASDDF